MWKMKRRRFVRMKLMSIPSPLFPLHPTYGPIPLVLHPPSSSPLPNIANHGTTSHCSAVTANPSLGIQPEPVHLRTSAYPNLTPCHPTYTPDFTSSSRHLHPQTHFPKTKHINSITYISTIPSLTWYTAMSQTSPAFPHPPPLSQRHTSHLE